LFVALCIKVAACDYEVARCDFVARQSRATKSRDKIAGVTWHLNCAPMICLLFASDDVIPGKHNQTAHETAY